ncbi:sensor domain-containing diguanylate cyclase [uncultured Castellaniella sp.]|uniref:sensor domain-containing diguanylate cyclase n=1 Tax=uncultured Castellaniella sp. TaxID=647907 RepID=UPI00260548CC|nr:sensor domain-containing diguanylate cyclase [uncultured Castellaniella sp.]
MGSEQRYAFNTPLCLATALLCLAVIGAIWLAVQQRIDSELDQAVNAAMRANSNLTIAFEQDIFRTLKAAEQVAAFAREGYLRHGTPPDLRGWVKAGVIREDMFTIISVVDEQGAIIASSQDTPPNVNYVDRDFFVAERNNPVDTLFISRPVLGRVSGQWRIPLSLRITLPDRRFGGVVVVAIDPAYLTNFYRQADLGAHGLLEVTGLDGYTRARKTGDKVSFNEDARKLPWFIRRADQPTGNFVDGADPDGVRRIISYRTLGGYPLMAVVGTAYDEAVAPVLHRRTGYLLAAGASSILILGFAAALILGISRQRAITLALQASESRLTHAARHDHLTGLPNRVLFQERCLRALESARRHGKQAAILYLDLDGFKAVNDSYGHVTGDVLLQQVAQRLKRQVRATSEDTVARFGGDEFAIALGGLQTQEEGERIIRNVLHALCQPFDLDGIEVRISASIGAVQYPLHGVDLDTLIGRADTAMYAAKNAGKNQFVWWSAGGQVD